MKSQPSLSERKKKGRQGAQKGEPWVPRELCLSAGVGRRHIKGRLTAKDKC